LLDGEGGKHKGGPLGRAGWAAVRVRFILPFQWPQSSAEKRPAAVQKRKETRKTRFARKGPGIRPGPHRPGHPRVGPTGRRVLDGPLRRVAWPLLRPRAAGR
jgi:hypothetical protein